MPRFRGWGRDWSNRLAFGGGLVVTAAGVVVGLLSLSALGYIFAALLAAAGLWLVFTELRERSRPKIDPRLELERDAGSLRPPDSDADIKNMAALGVAPEPDHEYTLQLRVKAEINPPLLDVECTGPIYSVICVYRLPEGDEIMTIEPVLRKPDRVLMRLGDKPLAAGTGVLLKLFSPVPIQLKRIAIGRQH
jgi:hypothetical protein